MSKMRARYHELVAEQSKLKEERERLINARSQALIDGAAFIEGDKIRSLHDEIIAIDDAIVTADAQAKVDEAREEAWIRAQSLLDTDRQIAELIARYVKVAADAQAKMLGVVEAFQEIHLVAEQLNKLGSPHSTEITGVIAAVNDMNVQSRLSEHLQDALANLKMGGYGTMQWTPRPPTGSDWSKQESDILTRAFAPARQTIQRRANELLAQAGE